MVSSVSSDTIASTLSSSTGLNSGLDITAVVNALLAIDQESITAMNAKVTAQKAKATAYANVGSKVSDLLASIKTLTTRDFNGLTGYDGMTATSSNSSIATASAASGASAQSLTLEVDSLPTPTKAASTGLVGSFDTTSTLSDLGVTSGTFTMYVNGTAHNYTVDGTNDNMGSVLDQINQDSSLGGAVSADIVNGKVSFNYTGGSATKISFGSGADTSNFLAKLHLDTAIDNGTDTIAASSGTTVIKTNQVMSSPSANLVTSVTDGTFSINGATFDSTGKTLDQMITEINSSATAKVSASFNKSSNTFTLISKNTGNSYINMASGTGNFLSAMNLVDPNTGSETPSQTLGTNAKFILNGTTMYSTGTSIDSNTTGLTGVTLNLASASVGTSTTINIGRDTDTLKSTITDIVAKYNTVISLIDTQTNAQNGGTLANETALKTLRNNIRSLFTSSPSGLAGSVFDSLPTIGISTGASTGKNSTNGSPTIVIDSAKLDAALKADPAAVRKLLIGQDLTGTQNGSAYDDNMEGTLTKVMHLIDDTTYTDGGGGYGALYAGTGGDTMGLFSSYAASSTKKVKTLNDSISRANDRLDAKQTILKAKYQAMDALIGQYNTQKSALTNLISSLTANNSN